MFAFVDEASLTTPAFTDPWRHAVGCTFADRGG